MNNRRKFCVGMAAAPLLTSAIPAWAQSWKHQMSMIVPYTAGGSADIFGRLFTEALGAQMDKKIVVENRPGGNAMLGAAHVSAAPADGQTLLYTYGNIMLNQEFLMKSRFRPLDMLVPVARTAIAQTLIVAAPEFPANNLNELIALAKSRPGELTYVYYGDLGITLMAIDAGIDMLRIPYKGGVPGMLDVMGQRVDIIMSSIAQAGPHLRDGKLKALAVFGNDRLAEFPDVATIKETLPKHQAFDYQVVMAPKDTPKPTLEQLAQHTNSALSDPRLKQTFLQRGAIVSYMGPEEVLQFMEKDRENIEKIVKIAGIQPE